MRTTQYLNAKYRVGVATPFCTMRAPYVGLTASNDLVLAVMDALDGIEDVISNECFSHPDTLTQDGITAYALALLRLRDCAKTAGFERLRNACDALAVTVSRLIENKSCASPEKCEALTRFVAHAWAMTQMYFGTPTHHAIPIPLPRSTARA